MQECLCDLLNKEKGETQAEKMSWCAVLFYSGHIFSIIHTRNEVTNISFNNSTDKFILSITCV